MRVLLIIALLLIGSRSAGTEAFPEYQIKAAFLINFASFVEFPEASNGSGDRFAMCVIGRDPFGMMLDQAAEGKSIHGRRIQILRVGLRETNACQTLFIPASESNHLDPILGALAGRSVLTVGESKGFAERGGIINFVIAGGRVRFEINPAMAARANLRIRSELLQVAAIVDGRAGADRRP